MLNIKYKNKYLKYKKKYIELKGGASLMGKIMELNSKKQKETAIIEKNIESKKKSIITNFISENLDEIRETVVNISNRVTLKGYLSLIGNTNIIDYNIPKKYIESYFKFLHHFDIDYQNTTYIYTPTIINIYVIGYICDQFNINQQEPYDKEFLKSIIKFVSDNVYEQLQSTFGNILNTIVTSDYLTKIGIDLQKYIVNKSVS
jgi:hypothetical protein